MKLFIRKSLACAAAAFLWLPVASVQPAFAANDNMAAGDVEEVITTGTRSKARSATQSPAPVDVISGDDFVNQAATDLSNLVRNIVPSYNVNSQPISDAATIVRPANLRGLAPDHTLVLINGKRRHRAAVIYWLGNGISDGAQGPDISAIPSIALKQVEVLRDGASSQYGSDAIAGVMNFILKDNNDGASFEAKFGTTTEGDGDNYSVAGNFGMPFTDDGFANFSFEYGEQDPTNRSIQRDDAAALIAAGNTAVANPAQIWGTPQVDDDLKLFANVGLDLGNEKEFYAHANLATKHVDGGFYFRNPNTRGAVFSGDGGDTLLIGDLALANDPDAAMDPGYMPCPTVDIDNDPMSSTFNQPDAVALAEVFARDECWSFQELFPGGFTPRFGGDVHDSALTAGVRGEFDNGIRWDASASTARNNVDFFIRNTVNASLGPATPTFFDPGAYTQWEQAVNLDFGMNPTDSTNLAFGAEYRKEEFEITVGQEESFLIGPLADQGFSAASNGFPGFSNIAGGKFARENIGVYVDGEWEVSPELLVGAAIRWEDFQDFGSTTNTKIAANWRADNGFGVRATYGTGFKAPTPGQSNAFNVSTEFDLVLNDLVNNGTVPPTTEVAQLRGGRPLGPEKSTNATFGLFFPLGNADITIDYFSIDLEDRLNLSGLFSLDQSEIDQLISEGVTSAGNLQNFRFFTNDFDTDTEGVDIVATLPVNWAGGRTNLTAVFNHTTTEVSRAGPTISNDPTRIREIEDGLPETRYNISANSFFGSWRILGRISYYDDWYDSEDGNKYKGKTLVDAEIANNLDNGFTVTLGAANLFDQVPDENPGAASGVGNRYSQFSPFGFNGATYYLRLQYDMNK